MCFFFVFFFGGGGGSFESGGSTGCHRVGLCVCVRRVRGPAARPRTGWNWISFVLRRFSPLFLRWIRQGLSPYWGLSLLSSLRCRVYRHSAANNVKVIGPAAKKTLTTAENPVPEIRKKNDWPRRFAKNVKPTMSWLRFGFLRPVLWVVVEKKTKVNEHEEGGLDLMFVFLLFRAMWRMWITCAFGTWCHSTFSWRINIGQQRCLLLESVRRVELALIANPTISLAGAGGVPANGHSWDRSAFYRVLLGFSLGFHRSADRCRPVAGLVEKKKTLDCFFFINWL